MPDSTQRTQKIHRSQATQRSPTSCRHTPRRSVLIRKKRLLCGTTLTYTLFARTDRAPVGFSIGIHRGGERALRDVGYDLTRAVCCFWRLFYGSVTPCTLGEILDDMRFEELF